jgi:hypothetical protein
MFPYWLNADNASAFLAALDMRSGNWRLSDWRLPPDNFVPTDLLCLAVLQQVFGPRPILLAAVTALFWSGIAVLAIRLAMRRIGPVRGPRMAWTAGAATATLLAVPIIRGNSYFDGILNVPIHMTTIILILLMIEVVVGLDQRPRATQPLRLAALMLMGTVGSFADPLMLYMGCLPIILACAAQLRRGRPIRSLVQAMAVLCAAAAAGRLLLRLNEMTGGFAGAALDVRFARFEDLGSYVAFGIQSVIGLMGAHFFGMAVSGAFPDGPAIFVIRSVLVLAVVIGAVRAARPLATAAAVWPEDPALPNTSMLDSTLLIAFAVCVVLPVLSNVLAPDAQRYFLPALVFGAILAARQCAASRLFTGYVAVALVASLSYDALALAAGPRRPVLFDPVQRQLFAALTARGLHHGFADYWMASLLTMQGRGGLQVLALASGPTSVAGYWWISSKDLYRTAMTWRGPVFFILGQPGAANAVPAAPVAALMGGAGRTFQVAGQQVVVFDVEDGRLSKLLP